MQLLDLMFLFLFVDHSGKTDFDSLEYEFSFCAKTTMSAANIPGLRVLNWGLTSCVHLLLEIFIWTSNVFINTEKIWIDAKQDTNRKQ